MNCEVKSRMQSLGWREWDPRTMWGPPNGGILAGMRVVELSAFVAVPLAGLTLSSLGADVIRVDPPRRRLGLWTLAGELPRAGVLYWAGLNAGEALRHPRHAK